MNKPLQDKISKIIMFVRTLFSSFGYHAKLILSIVFTVSIFVTFCSFLIISNIQSNIDAQIKELNHDLKIAQLLSASSSEIIYTHGTIYSKDRLKSLAQEYSSKYKQILFVVITDSSGNILYKSKLSHLYGLEDDRSYYKPPKSLPFIKIIQTNSGRVLNISEPIQHNNNLLGWVWVGIPDSGFTLVGSKQEMVIFLIQIFVIVWLISVIGAIVNSYILFRPLKKLEKSAKAITEGRFGFQLPLKGLLGRELTAVVKSFNKMSKRLEQYEESNLAMLSSERNKFESVVMAIADGVIVTDKRNVIQIINPATARLLDRSGDELIGQSIDTVWDTKTNQFVRDYLSSVMSNSDMESLDYGKYEFIRNNRNLIILITALHDVDDSQIGAVIVIQDRTKETEVELIKQEFISNVSHELRTPITSIKCYVDTLCAHGQDIDESTRKEFLKTINEETDRLSNLVNDVLELSRLESQSNKLHLSLQDVYPSIEFAVKAIQVLAHKKFIKLITEVDENLPPLRINQENLERILINLLSNAIKYTPGHGMIRLNIHQNEDTVLFQIIDNGIGIKDDHLPLIFERFYRVENKVHTVKGTGLGLTIVRKSIEQHGGNISVKSKLGEGSIFEFTIPIPKRDTNTLFDLGDDFFAKTA